MKIFDCITFFDEKMMFDLRLNILDKYVDKFVVVEQLYTHSGALKKRVFDINDFKKFKDKIIYILIEEEPKNLYKIDTRNPEHEGLKRINSLKRIGIQYNSILKGLIDADPNDLVMVSDCDEIPNLENLQLNRIKDNIILFKQKIFYYKFNLLHENMNWFGTKACKKKDLISCEWLKYIKHKKYPFWRLDTLFSKNKYTNIQIVDEGGWHFTNVKNNKDIFYKLMNYGEHNEFEKSGLDENKIQELIENNQLYFNHDLDKSQNGKYSAKIKLQKIENLHLPNYLNENKELYEEWFA
tara:strand:+ start:941 stop:1828 length:888 start_codon:yes stop_codon:yes gene_type:complete